MIPDLLDLGRRAVACRGWRWMPGMLAYDLRVRDSCEVRVYRTPLRDSIDVIHSGGNRWAIPLAARSPERDRWLWPGDPPYAIPDFSDPATLGCLLALVRVAHVDPTASAYALRNGSWEASVVLRSARPGELSAPVWRGSSEAEALVSALEAAP